MDGLDQVASLPCQSEREPLKYEQQANINTLMQYREGLQMLYITIIMYSNIWTAFCMSQSKPL